MSSQRLGILRLFALSEITANGVTSDPVPDVVGDRDEFSLLTKQWEFEGTFTDIHEFLYKITEVHFWLLVEEPHYFSSVHW